MSFLLYLALVCNCMSNGNHFYISFERSGGFAGMAISTEIKSDTLSVDEADKLVSLIEASGFFKNQAPKQTNSGVPDGFNYKLSIQLNGKSKSLEFGESTISDQMRPLIEELTRRSKRR